MYYDAIWDGRLRHQKYVYHAIPPSATSDSDKLSEVAVE